jgi:hypothetical protein
MGLAEKLVVRSLFLLVSISISNTASSAVTSDDAPLQVLASRDRGKTAKVELFVETFGSGAYIAKASRPIDGPYYGSE